jgi:hypothetical protein
MNQSASMAFRVAEERAMEVILALAVMFAIWVLVIWGSSYFNKNVV